MAIWRSCFGAADAAEALAAIEAAAETISGLRLLDADAATDDPSVMLRPDPGPAVLLACESGDGPTLQAAAEALEPFLSLHRRLDAYRTQSVSAEAERSAALRRLGRERLTPALIGRDGGLRPVLERVSMVASSDLPVLILGETGSGKEVIARSIHDGSPRSRGAFVRVNCGAIPPELIDSQLFGHEKGSFTGATDTRMGWFERAQGGTLFLDEVGELTPAAQVRLLRVLQDGSFERVGGQRPLQADCRVIAATHQDLPKLVQEGRFRQDLWYRLSVFPIVIPPLRERADDMRAMAEHFIDRAATRFGMPAHALTETDLRVLLRYDWPGNVRELAAVIDRAMLLGGGERIDIARSLGIDPTPRQSHEPAPEDPEDGGVTEPLDDAMRRHIQRALRLTRGRVDGPHGAAAQLRINPQTLRARMRKLGIDWKAFRAPAPRSKPAGERA